MGIQLKRCPFCNGTPYYEDDGANPFTLTGIRLRCSNCHIVTPVFTTYQELAAYWNTRYDEETDDDLK